MIPPAECPYKWRSDIPCWRCPHYIADTDSCMLADTVTEAATAYVARSYEERLERYKHDRDELLKLSKEQLVDLIIHKPELI